MKKIRAPRLLRPISINRRKPLLVARYGRKIAPNGRKESAPVPLTECESSREFTLNGIACAANQIQLDARIGSEVFPELLPAVAQANNAIKTEGKRSSATLLSACCSECRKIRAAKSYPFSRARMRFAVSLGVLPT